MTFPRSILRAKRLVSRRLSTAGNLIACTLNLCWIYREIGRSQRWRVLFLRLLREPRGGYCSQRDTMPVTPPLLAQACTAGVHHRFLSVCFQSTRIVQIHSVDVSCASSSRVRAGEGCDAMPSIIDFTRVFHVPGGHHFKLMQRGLLRSVGTLGEI